MDCKEGALEIGQQILQLLDQISPEQYASPLGILNEASPGQHFRHIIEFYHCLFTGMDSGMVDYASRNRDHRLEQDLDYAILAYQKLKEGLSGLNENAVISVKADFSASQRPVVQSTVGRELMFAYDHAVHHLAIIKIGLQHSIPGLKLDQHLGVAPSTVKYNRRNN
jgi:hypothetical protein